MPRVVHFEIHADDTERAREFYGNLFGWQFSTFGGPMDYWLVQTGTDGPGIDGGLLRRPCPAEGMGANAYVCTVDVSAVDDYCEKVTAAGGQIALPKMPVPGIGWLAYAQDPEGNTFGMMQMDPSAQ